MLDRVSRYQVDRKPSSLLKQVIMITVPLVLAVIACEAQAKEQPVGADQIRIFFNQEGDKVVFNGQAGLETMLPGVGKAEDPVTAAVIQYWKDDDGDLKFRRLAEFDLNLQFTGSIPGVNWERIDPSQMVAEVSKGGFTFGCPLARSQTIGTKSATFTCAVPDVLETGWRLGDQAGKEAALQAIEAKFPTRKPVTVFSAGRSQGD